MPKAAKRKRKPIISLVAATRTKARPKRKQKATPSTKGKIMTADKGKDDQPAPVKQAAPSTPVAATVSVPPADMMTEQEKDTSSDVPGVGPVSASQTTTGPAETIEDLGIGPREPYPEGGAPPEGGALQAKKGK